MLYQRGIYPPEMFHPEEHFGISLHDNRKVLKSLLKSVLDQVQDWICEKKMRKILLIITNRSTKEVLEQWDFNIDYEYDENGSAVENGKTCWKEGFATYQERNT